MFKLSSNSIMNMAGIDDRLVDVVELAITLTNIDFGVPKTGGLRTVQDQAQLFTSGKSKADGRTHKSYHQTGKAVDLFAYVDGKASWDELHLSLCAAAMLQAAAELNIPLKWGGLWKSWQDYPHFELKD
jgi:peptidoglycan L-alanyl-D-glutamate endopeptidase CwlK